MTDPDDLADRLDDLAGAFGDAEGEGETVTFRVFESERGPDGKPRRVSDEPALEWDVSVE